MVNVKQFQIIQYPKNFENLKIDDCYKLK